MAFNFDQPAYQEFRRIVAGRTRQVVPFIGSGLSAPAKVPSWLTLRARLSQAGEQTMLGFEAVRQTEIGLLKAATHENDLWKAFEYLQKALGQTAYQAEMRKAFEMVHNARLPNSYEQLWKLKVNGMVTTNVDGFCARSFASAFAGKMRLTEVSGVHVNRHPDLLAAGLPFVVNLHGQITETGSWVFTESELVRLHSNNAYRTFLNSLFTTRLVVFLGVSAEDVAIARVLAEMKTSGFNGSSHFWITSRQDEVSRRWAEEHNVQLISYSDPDGTHADLAALLSDISKYSIKEEQPMPISPSSSFGTEDDLPSPEVVEALKADEIRGILNRAARRILSGPEESREAAYRSFWEKYSEAIHRAWAVTPVEGRNSFLDYKVTRNLKKGGFGTIYEGVDPAGRRIALKVLHNVAKDDDVIISSFRRGVKAMRILSERGVAGMVPYEAAWEIPPSTVMPFVDGPNLEDAIMDRLVDSWDDRLRIAVQLAEIIKRAHSVPEGVLHRDIRPANIMLSDLYCDREEYNVVVLDFDLAWHKESAGNSIAITNSVNGFLAPELTSEGRRGSRNALVDSYGIGMTLFFMVARRQPKFSESQYTGWEETLKREVERESCQVWSSLPRRWSRLILEATRGQQELRWDLGRILGNLKFLKEAFHSSDKVFSADLIAEELFARSSLLKRDYVWNPNTLEGHFEVRPGYSVHIRGDESAKKVHLELKWMNTGESQFESVKKYLKDAAIRSEAALGDKGWVLGKRDQSPGVVRVTVSVPVSECRHPNRISKLSEGIDQAIERLRV